jgi:hypothetical protein
MEIDREVAISYTTSRDVAVEVPVSERPAIIKRYLDQVPGARPYIPVDRHAPLADFEAISSRYPVFRVVPDPG